MTFNPMPLGKFCHKIELQKLIEPPEKGPTGELIKKYYTYATVWAAFRTLSGGERLAAEQIAAILTHEITIAYRRDINPSHRIVYGSRIFDIKDVRNVDELNIELRMRCTELIG